MTREMVMRRIPSGDSADRPDHPGRAAATGSQETASPSVSDVFGIFSGSFRILRE